MPKHIIKRVLIGLVTLFVLASVTFFLVKATPGSLFSLTKYKTSEALAAAEIKYNLDKPLVEQYVIYLKGVAQGNLGENMISTGRSASYYIKTDFPVIARLGLIVFVLVLVGGIALGTGVVLSRHKWVSNLCAFVATIGVSVPSSLIATIMLIVFGVQLYILPLISLSSPLNYVTPALLLTFYPIAMITRLTRSSMLEVINQSYTILARSKGMPRKKVVIKHALKNAMLPVMTYAGSMSAFILTGSFVTESVFSIPGIGGASISCITTRDYPIIAGLTIFLGFLVITSNLITSILSAIIDPRIKLDQEVKAMSDKLLQEGLSDDLFERPDDFEKSAERIAYGSRTYLADVWYRFRQNELAFVGFCFPMFMLLCVIIIPMISPHTYDGQNLELRNTGPSLQHLMGTDKFGRDILVRTMWDRHASLSVGFAAALVSLGAGILYGGIAGYFGGKIDVAMMRSVDMMYSIPDTLYVIVIVMVMGPSISSILIGICISPRMGMARQVQAQVMTLKEQEFSLAVKVLGAGTGHIIFKHLIINSIGSIIVFVTMLVPNAISYEAFLGFLGIGLSAPQASWGMLANEARSVLTSYPLQTLWPILAICLMMFALNFIGDGLGDVPDPKKKRKQGGNYMSMPEIQRLSTDSETENDVAHTVRDASLSVGKGEVLEIAGESGSGKSQTTSSTMGLSSSNGIVKDGSITIDGKEILPEALSDRREYEQAMDHTRGNGLVMIFQDPMTLLNPVLCTETRLMEPILDHMDISKEEVKKRAIELIRKVGIPSPEVRIRQYPHQLSGGMQQHTIIAIALAYNPKIITADELMTALDVTIQAQVLELIPHLKEEIDSGIIMITHDLGVVVSICDRIATMYGGKVVGTGMVFEIFEHPQYPYMIGLLSCISNPNESEKKELHPIPGSPPDLLNIQENCPFAGYHVSAMKICKPYMPQEAQISAIHRCSCWLQHPKACKGGEV